MIEVTIKNDDEGFYGSSSSEEIAAIDHDKSVWKFQKMMLMAIRDVYSAREMEVHFEYGGYAGKSIFVNSDDPDDDEDEISDTLQEIVGMVYEGGMFWVENDKQTVQ